MGITVKDHHIRTVTADSMPSGYKVEFVAEEINGVQSVKIVLPGTTTRTFSREDFLDAVVALYPEHVAYQFPSKDEDDDG